MKIDVDEIEKAKLTIDEALVLVYMEYIRRLKVYPGNAPDMSLYLKLVQDGLLYVNEEGFGITVDGFQKFRLITGTKQLHINKEPVAEYTFEEFWNEFPANDSHGIWGRTRALRSNKEGCKKLYVQCLVNGVSKENILKALKWQVKQFKEASITSNRLSFMKNSYTWLLRKEYEVILEEIKNESTESLEHTGDSWTETIV